MKRKVLIMIITVVTLVWFVGLAGAGPLSRAVVQGDAPTMVSYQGQVTVGGSPYNGTGYFKFAVVNAAGDTSYWSNDGSSGGRIEPDNGVQLTVNNGLFNVLLGDTSLTNMTSLEAAVFSGAERYLRVWFSGNNVIYKPLSPDRRIASVPYALQAQEAGNADTLDGMHGVDYQNASNINADTLSSDHYSAIADLGAEGYLGNASGDLAQNNGTLQTNLNADLLDGMHGGDYLNASNLNAGTLSSERYSAYADLGTEGRLDNNSGSDLLTRSQADIRYVNEGQDSSVNSVMIVDGAVTSDDLQDGAALAEMLDDDGNSSGLDADLLDGMHGDTYLNASNINSGTLSADYYSAISDLGAEDYLGNASADLAQNNGILQSTLNADLLDGFQATAFQQHYHNVVIVAKSGGDFTSIQAALDSITDTSTTNRYLVWVAPGTYTETVSMKPYVDIEGAGEMVTKITYTGSEDWEGTVNGANNAELRFLTVENTGIYSYAIGILNNHASPSLIHVTASAWGGSVYSFGVSNLYNASPLMTHVTAKASGTTTNHGVDNYYDSSPTLIDVTAIASGGSINRGLYNFAECSPTVRNSLISGSGGAENYGVFNESGPNTVTINNSQVIGSTNTIDSGSGNFRVGASLLDGGPVTGGTVTCAGVYDENYTFYASTCP